MEHFVCTGNCHGVSERPKVCEAGECSKKGEPLATCVCFDNAHADAHQETGKPHQA